ncbi:hypothetical protein BZA77DRAFT_133551 [Pyronema omphalodes]|nr:hypothetical protein BZA77DRAFT_133551 [Pyronema omphalodes]
MAFLFGKKKGTRDQPPAPVAAVAATNSSVATTTPPSSINNSSLSSLQSAPVFDEKSSGSARSGTGYQLGGQSGQGQGQNQSQTQTQAQGPPVGLRNHQAHSSESGGSSGFSGPSPHQSQGRLLQQSSPAQQLSSNASLYPWSQRRLTLSSSHPSPFPRYGHAANAVSSKEGDIYIMGGLIRSQNVRGDLWMIEGGNSNERLESYPVMTTSEGPGPRVGHASLLVGNAFIVFGGDTKLDERDVLDETLYLLNTSTRQWSRASPHGHRPSGRYGHTLNILGSKLYIFGGQVDTVFFNDLVAFDLNTLQHVGSKWEVLASGDGADIPASRTNHTMITFEDKLYLFGGTNGVEWFNDVWSYNPKTNLWTQLDCIGYIPSPREGHAAALVNDVMYIFGGRSSEGLDLGDLAAFRISSRRWYTFQNMGPSPSPRSGHTMTTVNNKIIVLGGEPSVPSKSQEELQMVYVLDTAKIRYPTDGAHQSPGDRPRAGSQPRPNARGGSIDVTAPRDPRGDPRGQQQKIMGPPRENGMGPGPQHPGGGSPMQSGPNSINGSPVGPNSRLPRASPGGPQPSGPPPSQQAPPPRPGQNGGPPPGAAARNAGPPSTPQSRGKENMSPIDTKPTAASFPSAPNGMRTPTQDRAPQMQRKDSRDGSLNETPRSRHAHQHSLDSIKSAETATEEPRTPQSVASNTQRPAIGIRPPEDQPGFDPSSPDSVYAPSTSLDTAVDSAEVEKLRRLNDWYASELALARRAGYTPAASNATAFEDRTREMSEDDRPFVEALLLLKAELSKVQTELDSQSSIAAQKMQEIERQRDVAVQEAVYAKAKLAALGGPATPTPGSETASMDQEKMTDMSRKLAASLSAQADLSAQNQALNLEVAAEKKARLLADETAAEAQKRITELDDYRSWAASEIETLRAELLDAGRAYRDEASAGQEAAATVKMLQIDQSELTSRLEEALAENKNYKSSLEHLSKAMQLTNQKADTLERQLEEERITKEALDRKLAQLRSENEERSADLQNLNQRLKDTEELMQTYSEQAKAANAVLAAGLDKVAQREVPAMLASAAEERVVVLMQQVENTQALLAKSKAQADETGEKLAEAMQRVAGLEFQQGQSSKDSIALRRRMAEVGEEARRLKKENTELLSKLNARQLEVDAITAKHNALKDILQERGIDAHPGHTAGAHSHSRSVTLQSSPNSGTATPEQLSRLRELEQRLEESLRAHRETKSTADLQAQEVEKHFREKLEQLENDYQSAVHYVKGTEKMLKRMKEELAKYKTANQQLQSQLEEAEARAASNPLGLDAPRTVSARTTSEADWDQERELLNQEIDNLRTQVRESTMALDKQIQNTKQSLDTLREDRDRFKSELSTSRNRIEQLSNENLILENRAMSAEQKVSMLLDQVENSVDAYRRSMRFEPANGNNNPHGTDSARSSYYGPGVENRSSVALDSLASELDALRNHWESTNKTYRLSNAFDFDKSPTSATTTATAGHGAYPAQGDFQSSIQQWRQKLQVDDEEADNRRSAGSNVTERGYGGQAPSAATVAAGGGVI